MQHELNIKRSYDPETPEDGTRILVDRLWPRGESRAKADLAEWDKAIAPAADLRKAFHEGELPFEEFARLYRRQLEESCEAAQFADHVRDLLKQGNVTLLYASRDREHNNALVLKNWLEEKGVRS